jgi:ElaB/YqjD/DUF883 family membrane-anchored ribosome-binding protein
MMANGSVQNPVVKAAAAVREGDLETAKENVEVAARRATNELTRVSKAAAGQVADRVTRSAQERPLLTVGVALGVGALLGAIIYQALRPEPTVRQVLLKALDQGRIDLKDKLVSGLSRARSSLA